VSGYLNAECFPYQTTFAAHHFERHRYVGVMVGEQVVFPGLVQRSFQISCQSGFPLGHGVDVLVPSLATRWRFLEDLFGGLDKVYQVHKRLGRWAFWIILLHPLFLAADRIPEFRAFLADLWFQMPQGDLYLMGHNFSVVTMIFMAPLIALTLWIRLPYHLWKYTHEWFGVVLLFIIIHIVLVDADIAKYPFLGIWVYVFLVLAAGAYVYMRFLYRFFGPRHPYALAHKELVGDILELTFSPRGKKMDFRPGQFIYLLVHKAGISPEPHPYSIACGYNLEGNFKLGIKEVGDHTRSLRRLEKGDLVTV
jgi:predicted ferric reductase